MATPEWASGLRDDTRRFEVGLSKMCFSVGTAKLWGAARNSRRKVLSAGELYVENGKRN